MVTEVAKSLAFAPALHALADRVVAGVTGGGAHPFNGVHLRVEKDARDWATIMGGTQVVWQGYVDTMRGVGFNATTRLYAASGMLTYGASGARVGGVGGGGARSGGQDGARGSRTGRARSGADGMLVEPGDGGPGEAQSSPGIAPFPCFTRCAHPCHAVPPPPTPCP